MRELHMVPGSNGVQRALTKRHSENAYYELMRGSVRRKHLAQEISTLVANQSARAQMHDLNKEMDSRGVRVDASVTLGVKALLHRTFFQNSRMLGNFV